MLFRNAQAMCDYGAVQHMPLALAAQRAQTYLIAITDCMDMYADHWSGHYCATRYINTYSETIASAWDSVRYFIDRAQYAQFMAQPEQAAALYMHAIACAVYHIREFVEMDNNGVFLTADHNTDC
jgi:hypothetical protein